MCVFQLGPIPTLPFSSKPRFLFNNPDHDDPLSPLFLIPFPHPMASAASFFLLILKCFYVSNELHECLSSQKICTKRDPINACTNVGLFKGKIPPTLARHGPYFRLICPNQRLGASQSSYPSHLMWGGASIIYSL